MNDRRFSRYRGTGATLALACVLGCGSVAAEHDGGPADGGGGQGGVGSGGQSGGSGGQGSGGNDGRPDAAADGKVGACQQIATVDRSCTTNADCLAITHTINCCGTDVWMGIRSSESQRFALLETACDTSYPACGCGTAPPTTDDGSIVGFGGAAPGVSCQGGLCKTFSPTCGPCGDGKSCLNCANGNRVSPPAPSPPAPAMTGVCSQRCTADSGCTDAPRTKCRFSGLGGGLCVDAASACATGG